MKVKALKNFKDRKADVVRNVGETFEVSKERFEEINATKNGKLVDEVKETKKK